MRSDEIKFAVKTGVGAGLLCVQINARITVELIREAADYLLFCMVGYCCLTDTFSDFWLIATRPTWKEYRGEWAM